MALSRVKTWIAGETLTAADLNAEFTNILNNPISLISPLAANLDLDANALLLDGDQDTTITADTDDRIDFALSGTDLFRMDGTATTPVNGLTFIARATGSKPSLQALTSDANEGLDIRDDNGNEILILSAVASAANEVTITNAATTGDVSVAATGSDTNVSLDLVSKGSGTVKINGTSTGALAALDSVDGTKIVIGSDAQGDILYRNASQWTRLAAGTSGQYLQTQGAGANPQWVSLGQTVTVEDVNAAANEIVNTVTETALYSYTVPGGTLGSNKALRVNIIGDYLNNSGASATITIAIKYGATTMWADTVTPSASTSRRGFVLDFILGAGNSTLVQELGGHLLLSGTGAATSGIGVWTSSGQFDAYFAGSAAETSTSNKVLTVTATHGTADANISIRAKYRIIELLP